MKKIFFFTMMFSAITSYAQKNGKIILDKGQKITVVSTITADTDMGMGMQMKNITSSTNVLSVIAVDDKSFTISNTTTKLNVSMDMMGQQTTYDSEKPEDKESELGKEISPKLNAPDTLLVDKSSGEVVKTKKEDSPERPAKTDDDSNPLEGIMGAIGGNADSNAALEGAFFIVPKGKKTGDCWMDSTSEKNITKVKTYTIKSIEKTIVTILTKGTLSGNGETEMQGTSVAFSMNTKSTGEITVDIKTGLVSKTTTQADITGTFDVMGQSMPITSKANSTVLYQY